MPGYPSAIGYGFQLWGHFPFGSSDWAEEVTWKILPIFYREDDIVAPGLVDAPLRKLIDSIKPLFEEWRFKWQQFPSLMNPLLCPLSNLPQLAYTVGLVDDADRPEPLRRSRIYNVTQLVLNKGNDKGYLIVGAFEGLLVAITPLWASDCSPAATLSDQGPTVWVPSFADFAADELFCDQTFSGPYEQWPRFLQSTGPCPAPWLDLFFYAPGDVDIQNYTPVVLRILADLERVRPIHVRFNSVRFDGPRVAAGGWTIQVAADAIAAAGGWSIPVVGSLYAAAGGFTIPVVATPTP